MKNIKECQELNDEVTANFLSDKMEQRKNGLDVEIIYRAMILFKVTNF
jgi:hypothetical protein